MRATQIVRPDARGETELGRVRDLDRIILGVERDDRQDRSEDLLLRDRRGSVDVSEHGRTDEERRGLARDRFSATRDHPCTRRLAVRDHAADALELGTIADGTHLCARFARIAQPNALRPFGDRVDDASYSDRCTRRRLPATHVWPPAEKIPAMAPATASSTSASSKMMFGDLPPSSRVTGTRVFAAAAEMARPPSRRFP